MIKNGGIEYISPEVLLLDHTSTPVAEFFARTAYDSYDKTQSKSVSSIYNYVFGDNNFADFVEFEDSSLLQQLSHVYFHESTLEHIYCNFFFKNVSRGLLQELARHRIASPTVRSTRYTLSNILYVFIAAMEYCEDEEWFINHLMKMNNKSPILVTTQDEYNKIEFLTIYNKLKFQMLELGFEKFKQEIVPSSLLDSSIDVHSTEEYIEYLSTSTKKNVGDSFKHIVTDNFVCHLGFSINLRSLKNLIKLRLSGSAWFQFRELSRKILEELPPEMKSLILKETN